MNLEIQKAIKVPFENKQALIPAAIATIIQVILYSFPIVLIINQIIDPILILLAIILVIFGALITYMLSGYSLSAAHNCFMGHKKIMPDWDDNYITFFVRGFKFFVVQSAYSIIPIIPPLLISLFTVIFIPVFILNGGKPEDMGSFGIIFSILQILANILQIILQIIVILFIMASTMIMIKSFSVKQALNIKKVYSFIKDNLLEIVIAFLINIVIGLVVLVSICLCLMTCIGIFAIPFVIFLLQIIAFNLFAQVYKNIEQKNIPTEPIKGE